MIAKAGGSARIAAKASETDSAVVTMKPRAAIALAGQAVEERPVVVHDEKARILFEARAAPRSFVRLLLGRHCARSRLLPDWPTMAQAAAIIFEMVYERPSGADDK